MGAMIALAQCGYPVDGNVSAQVAAWCEKAAAQGAELVVFPEDLMSPRPLTAEELRAIAEPLDGPFVRGIADAARCSGLWVVFTMYERDGAGGRPHNVAVVIDDGGCVRGIYHKTHLYDAHGVYESARTVAGDKLFEPVDTPFGRLGLGICYDLRFPEVARAAALAGCTVLALPSAWYDGPEKAAHWETLLRARAIENELFVLGVCRAGERYVGMSLVADPLGRVVAHAQGKGEELVVCELDTDEVLRARAAMPVLEHLRPELYR